MLPPLLVVVPRQMVRHGRLSAVGSSKPRDGEEEGALVHAEQREAIRGGGGGRDAARPHAHRHPPVVRVETRSSRVDRSGCGPAWRVYVIKAGAPTTGACTRRPPSAAADEDQERRTAGRRPLHGTAPPSQPAGCPLLGRTVRSVPSVAKGIKNRCTHRAARRLCLAAGVCSYSRPTGWNVASNSIYHYLKKMTSRKA